MMMTIKKCKKSLCSDLEIKLHGVYTFEKTKTMLQHSNQTLPVCFSSLFTNISCMHIRQIRSIINKNLYFLNSLHPVDMNLIIKDQKFGILYSKTKFGIP